MAISRRQLQGLIISCSLFLFLLNGCGGASGSHPFNGDWHVTSVSLNGGKSINTIAEKAKLTVSGSDVSGNDGHNVYYANYNYRGSEVTVRFKSATAAGWNPITPSGKAIVNAFPTLLLGGSFSFFRKGDLLIVKGVRYSLVLNKL